MQKRSRYLPAIQIRRSLKGRIFGASHITDVPYRSRSWKALCFLIAVNAVACSATPEPKNIADFQCPTGQVRKDEFCVAEKPQEPEKVVPLVESPLAEEQQSTKEPLADKEELAESEAGSELMTEEACSAELMSQDPLPAACVVPSVEDEIVSEPLSLASPVDISMAAQAGPIVHHLAAAYLPGGARSLGVPFAAQFVAGQALVQEVQLEKDRCYTVVAVGLPPIKELNLALYQGDEVLSSELSEEGRLASDDSAGSQAVLGARATCFSPNVTAVYQLGLQVESGQGVAAGQVFQK